MKAKHVDLDDVDQVELDEEALNAALDAANEAHVAGQDDHEQLIAAIKAYVWTAGR